MSNLFENNFFKIIINKFYQNKLKLNLIHKIILHKKVARLTLVKKKALRVAIWFRWVFLA